MMSAVLLFSTVEHQFIRYFLIINSKLSCLFLFDLSALESGPFFWTD